MDNNKAVILKNHYFHVVAGSLNRKFHADSKTYLKIPNTMLEGHKVLDSNFGEMEGQFLKLYGKGWPKFEQASKKIPTIQMLHGTLELSAFDTSALFAHIK